LLKKTERRDRDLCTWLVPERLGLVPDGGSRFKVQEFKDRLGRKLARFDNSQNVKMRTVSPQTMF
jgi:hypothetical protein